MSLFARLVSRNYRRGLAAEARGQLAQAAEAFARAGRSQDVVRVRRQLATRAEDPAQRARALREVLILGEGILDADALRGLRAEAARALIRVEGDPEAHGEAATLFEQAGDHLGAADALLSLGRYEQARRVLEALLDKYEDEGFINLDDPKVLKLDPFRTWGTNVELVKAFGTGEDFVRAVHELQAALYEEVA